MIEINIPPSALMLIKHFEGCRLQAYQDCVGVWTIGYGETKNVTPGLIISQSQADEFLYQDLINLNDRLNHLIKVPLNDNQRAALLDFCYNLGLGALQCSGLRAKLNRKDYNGASHEFPKWCYAGHQKLIGLLNRRKAEVILFNS
jgi:lysozyme